MSFITLFSRILSFWRVPDHTNGLYYSIPQYTQYYYVIIIIIFLFQTHTHIIYSPLPSAFKCPRHIHPRPHFYCGDDGFINPFHHAIEYHSPLPPGLFTWFVLLQSFLSPPLPLFLFPPLPSIPSVSLSNIPIYIYRCSPIHFLFRSFIRSGGNGGHF